MRGLDLHLDGPPVVAVLHPEGLQGIPTDRAKWAEIGVADAVQEAKRTAGDRVAELLLRAERALIPAAASTGTDHHVGVAGADRVDQRGELAGVVTVVAVEEHDDVRRIGSEVREGFQARGAVAALGLVDDFGPVLSGYLGGAIGGAVVGDDDAADRWARDVAQDQREGVLLVESRDYDGDVFYYRRFE